MVGFTLAVALAAYALGAARAREVNPRASGGTNKGIGPRSPGLDDVELLVPLPPRAPEEGPSPYKLGDRTIALPDGLPQLPRAGRHLALVGAHSQSSDTPGVLTTASAIALLEGSQDAFDALESILFGVARLSTADAFLELGRCLSALESSLTDGAVSAAVVVLAEAGGLEATLLGHRQGAIQVWVHRPGESPTQSESDGPLRSVAVVAGDRIVLVNGALATALGVEELSSTITRAGQSPAELTRALIRAALGKGADSSPVTAAAADVTIPSIDHEATYPVEESEARC